MIYMPMDGVTIRQAGAAEVVDLRHAVLRVGLPRQTAVFPGDDDVTSVHLVAETDGRVVGCVTLHLNQWDDETAYQLRGMAVAPELRGSGIGTDLLDAVEQRIAQEGRTTLLWCNARVPAVDFYRKHGWRVVSDEFEVPTAGPHMKMLKRLGSNVR